LIPYIFPMI
jgi:hypothetical protein